MTPISRTPDAVMTDDLDAVALDELTERAALLTRVDRKYVVPLVAVDDLLHGLARVHGGARVLEVDGRRSFAYRSVYLDTPDLLTYRQAAHRRPRRFKVRTRSYLDAGEDWLEVKVRDRRGRTVKERLPWPDAVPRPAPDRVRVVAGEETLAFTRDVLQAHQILPDELDLHPVLATTYRRATVWLPGQDARLTIDTSLECRALGGTAALPWRAVVETKTAGGPSAADHLLWAAGHRPARFSKYATGLAAFDATLPANRWRPVLRRHPFVVVEADRSAAAQGAHRTTTALRASVGTTHRPTTTWSTR